jgi:hypothetical protein
MPQPTWKITVGAAKEVTWGVPVSPPTVYFSTDKPAFTVKQTAIYDKGIRGIRAETQAMVFGEGMTNIDIPNMPFYGDDSGHLLMALLGTDTFTGTARSGTIAASIVGATTLTYTVVSGGAPIVGDVFKLVDATNGNEIVTPSAVSGAGPYTLTVPATKYAHGAATPASTLFSHVLTLLNSGAPPSYTFAKYDALVATMQQFPGTYCTELVLKFTNPGALTADLKGLGKMGTNVANTTAAYSAEPFYVPWQASFQIAGVANARVVDFEIDLKAPSTQIFGMSATQSPSAAVAGRVGLTGKFTIVPDDYTEWNYYLNNTQPATVCTVDNGSTRTTFQMSKTAFTDPVMLDHSSDHTALSASFEAISNSTDAGTGNAPLKVTMLNGKAAAY